MQLRHILRNDNKISSVINLFFKGQMEYAIISFSVGGKILSWLFHVFIFKFFTGLVELHDKIKSCKVSQNW